MDLYILRHGTAENFAPSDAERALTEYGRAQASSLAEFFAELSIDTVSGHAKAFISPYLRTQQTAQLAFAEAPLIERENSNAVLSEAPTAAAMELIDSALDEGVETLILVSHQPLVGTLIALLCSGDAGHMAYEPMMPASLAFLSLDVAAPGCAELNWIKHSQSP